MFFKKLFTKGKSIECTVDFKINNITEWDKLSVDERADLVQWAVPISQNFGMIAEKASRMIESKAILNDSYENIRLALCITGIYMLIQDNNKMFDSCMTAIVVLSNFVDASEEEVDSILINNIGRVNVDASEVVKFAEKMVETEELQGKLQQQQFAQAADNIAFANAFFKRTVIRSG